MRGMWVFAATATVVLLAGISAGQERKAKQGGKDTAISFKDDVMPVIEKHCLPCHAEENFNPSELSLDSYDNLMAGGKHGSPVVPGDASESIIIQKLGPEPPFGDRMPLVKKKDPVPDKLTQEEIDTITEWISQGAKDN